MKQFFGGCFGAFFGVIIGVIIFGIIIIIGISKSIHDATSGISLNKNQPTEIYSDNSILKIKLSGEIKEYETGFKWDFNFKDFLKDKDFILPQMVRTIDAAAKDDKIKAIYIRIYPYTASVTQLEELREALNEFKKAGKKIYVYADNYYQGDYYLSSIADKIMMHPEGTLFWKGLASQISFYKKALEKLDIQVQIFRHGKFKSAVEPFMLDKMSEENRQQMRALIGSVWKDFLKKIADSRKISEQTLNNLANQLDVKDGISAIHYKLIDTLIDEYQAEKFIKNNMNKSGEIEFTDYHYYKYYAFEKYKNKSNNKIAVLYASGQIVDYKENNDDVITPSEFIKTLKKIQEDKNIKALVIRVNSPGGSAFASEKIWQSIKELKSKIPVIVSFGEVAASGGYYISCSADYIFTDHNTITGSIGVFGLLPNIQTLMQKDLGIYTDTVKTNTYADFMSILRPVTPKEYDVIMYRIEKTYDTFLSRVSEGRKLDKTYIDNIGQGRVWSGADAVKLKLADEIGTLKDAIAYAAKKINTEKFQLVEYPQKKDPWEDLFNKFSDDDVQEKILKTNIGKHYKNILILKNSLKNQQVNYLTLMPCQVDIY